eukprot:CAMPEP_0172306810 /NCGR_PEP_ID=MMETSP1058-20130122/7800_1 /TAXON_ID=83371 /ORGANISM="Detonula confervacea, Strain CCMP 353" /LENGTH=341 /DNA_ID=CAMNT_0013018805 /DNA_START=36 /DNA_END=1061 /DNA_ORIENTATION=-
MRLNLYAAALLFIGTTSAFVSPQRSTNLHHSNNFQQDILQIRGGDMNMMPSTTSALSSTIGPVIETLHQTLVSGTPLRAIGALYAVASLTVVPLTWYRTAYSFSVGYGLSVAAMSVALLSAFPVSGGSFSMASAPSLLALTTLVYGVRLAAFIFAREKTVESKRKAFDEMNSRPVLSRTPLALGVALLYAFMMSPALFALRGAVTAGSVSEKAQVFFTGVAAFGMILESVADQHKYEVKRQSKEGEDKFVGPTTWSYKLCRHPNYLGEILHWSGIFAAGSVSFGKSITAWVPGVLGLWGILSIMFGASSRLDKKQSEKYDGQPAYDEWKGKVASSVIPFVK